MAPVGHVLYPLPCTTFRCEKQHRASELLVISSTRRIWYSLSPSKETLVFLRMLDLKANLEVLPIIM